LVLWMREGTGWEGWGKDPLDRMNPLSRNVLVGAMPTSEGEMRTTPAGFTETRRRPSTRTGWVNAG
jgi:hypothetical protein